MHIFLKIFGNNGSSIQLTVEVSKTISRRSKNLL